MPSPGSCHFAVCHPGMMKYIPPIMKTYFSNHSEFLEVSRRRSGADPQFPDRGAASGRGPKERGDCGGADAGEGPLRGSGAQVLALLPRHRGQAPPQTTATQPRTRGEAGGSTKRPVERGVVCGERNGSERAQGRERSGGGSPGEPGSPVAGEAAAGGAT